MSATPLDAVANAIAARDALHAALVEARGALDGVRERGHDGLGDVLERIDVALKAARDGIPRKDMDAAHHRLVASLAVLKPPCFSLKPDPDDFGAAAAHLCDLARIIDRYIAALGCIASEHAPCPVPQDLFEDQLLGAIEGNATHALESVARRIAQDRREDLAPAVRRAEDFMLAPG